MRVMFAVAEEVRGNTNSLFTGRERDRDREMEQDGGGERERVSARSRMGVRLSVAYGGFFSAEINVDLLIL